MGKLSAVVVLSSLLVACGGAEVSRAEPAPEPCEAPLITAPPPCEMSLDAPRPEDASGLFFLGEVGFPGEKLHLVRGCGLSSVREIRVGALDVEHEGRSVPFTVYDDRTLAFFVPDAKADLGVDENYGHHSPVRISGSAVLRGYVTFLPLCADLPEDTTPWPMCLAGVRDKAVAATP